MRKTPQYLLAFYQSGDLYRASDDLDRMTVIDNQLADLASVVGNGALTADSWNIVQVSGLNIMVTPGTGFISGILHETLSDKNLSVFDNATSRIYMKSTAIGTGALELEIEGPASGKNWTDVTINGVSVKLALAPILVPAIYLDNVPPGEPTGFSGSSPSYDIVDLAWNNNPEPDFSHYRLDRSTDGIHFSTLVASLQANAYEDQGLVGSTAYYYNLYAIDFSGNASTRATTPVTTAANTTKPAAISNLRLFPGNSSISVVFERSPSNDIEGYLVTYSQLSASGTSIFTSQPQDIGPSTVVALGGLVNNSMYLVSVTPKNIVGNLGDTVSASAMPMPSNAPAEVASFYATPGANKGSINLYWSTSPSASGLAMGQKTSYIIRVIDEQGESDPINVGLLTPLPANVPKVLVTYTESGVAKFFEDNVEYLFRLTVIDSFGNESSGMFAKGETANITPPANPRNFKIVPGDESASLSWDNSPSSNVIGYTLTWENTQTSQVNGPISLGYTDHYMLTGLPNGTVVLIKIYAEGDNGQPSTGVSLSTTANINTTPPDVPTNLVLGARDEQVNVTWTASLAPTTDHYVVKRQQIFQPLDSNPNTIWTPVGDPILFDPIHGTQLLDTGLVNGQTYQYSVKAVDTRGNESDFSPFQMTSPDQGTNVTETFTNDNNFTCTKQRLDAPHDVSASPGIGEITVQWQFDFQGSYQNLDGTWSYATPGANCSPTDVGAPTAFNVYRSEYPYANYALIESVDSSLRKYVDANLVSGKTYYYKVSAARDSAVALADTGNIQPANTVLIGTVTATNGSISISENKNVVKGLAATIAAATLAAIESHEHSVAPINDVTVAAISTLAMIDAGTLASSTITADAAFLSNEATNYYNGLLSSAGSTISYTAGTTYVVDPAAVTYNVPSVGDFQVLVNGSRPTAEFILDDSSNAIIFAAALGDSDIVSLAGLGFSYYVPAKMNSDYAGFDIRVNGSPASPPPLVDRERQVLRFISPLASTDAVSAVIEPTLPDFDDEVGARQINLSPNSVLNDFRAVNPTTYASASGDFQSTDSVVVLVNGATTLLGNYVDFAAKTVVFSSPLPAGTSVALMVIGREEVTNTLPLDRVGDLDASQFSTGTLLPAQLPPLSHEGRMREPMAPLFNSLSTSDSYVYQAAAGVLGTATTPYAIFQSEQNDMTIGTSQGVLRSLFVPGLIVGAGDTVNAKGQVQGAGLSFSPGSFAVNAVRTEQYSGRYKGNIVLTHAPSSIPGAWVWETGSQVTFFTSDMVLTDPSITLLDDGTVLITGGYVNGNTVPDVSACFIYNPTTAPVNGLQPNMFRETGSMAQVRRWHSCTRLPGGQVLVTGGYVDAASAVFATGQPDMLYGQPGPGANPQQWWNANYPSGTAYLNFRNTCEIYDPLSGTWAAVPNSMAHPRYNHGAIVMDSGEVLVAGGKAATSDGKNFDATKETASDYLNGSPNTMGANYFILFNDYIYWQWADLSSAEIFSPATKSWRQTTAMDYQTQSDGISESNGKVIFVGDQATEIYDPSSEKWESSAASPTAVNNAFSGSAAIDGPIKKFLLDSSGTLWAVTKNSIFASGDAGVTFVQSLGLDATSVVHAIAEGADGTMFAATDLGVYEMAIAERSQLTWFQGGLIGAGTTETFDLLSAGAYMLAATEIGIFSSVDDGNTWTSSPGSTDVQGVTCLAAFGQSILALAGQFIYRSEDGGYTWPVKHGPFYFVDENARLITRQPLDMFMATANGLYSSPDGNAFSLVDFDVNRNQATNNVHMVEMVGGDLYVGYDNLIFAVGPDYGINLIAQFTGTVPTVIANGTEQRNGFRYYVPQNRLIFENKRLVGDAVTATSNYSLYQMVGGGWYKQNADAAVQVFANNIEQADGTFVMDAKLGQFSFTTAFNKTDVLTASIVGTTLINGGQHFHAELENEMDSQDGLPLSMTTDVATNLLQFGMRATHSPPVLLSNLRNAEFVRAVPDYDAGGQVIDWFSSTINYQIQSSQSEIGVSSILPMCLLQVGDEIWVGTENGLFFVSTTDFSFTTMEVGSADNPVRSLYAFMGQVYAATRDGIFIIPTDKSAPIWSTAVGLPEPYSLSSINNILVAGATDGIYYSESPYDTWLEGTFSNANGTQQLFLSGKCNALLYDSGAVFAAIESGFFVSADGKTWMNAFNFKDGTIINVMCSFQQQLFLGTDSGIYSDNGTARSSNVNFGIQTIAANGSSSFQANDLFAISSQTPSGAQTGSLYAAGYGGSILSQLYMLNNNAWQPIPMPQNVAAVHKFIVVTNAGNTTNVAFSNNMILVG